MLIVVSCWWFIVGTTASTVLDPALYLAPSPPMAPNSHSILPGELWSPSRREREADLSVVPLELVQKQTSTTTEKQELMEKAETFWPSLRTTRYGFGGIHIPLTFSLSGTYGRYGTGSMGVIGSSYASVADDGSGLFGVGKSGLAGSGYKSFAQYPGTRIYGSSGGAAWSGWGNGKWGHYGKG